MMTTNDLEKFRKIPRNDVLIYLHQYNHFSKEIKVKDIYDRINKPTSVFHFIIQDLLRLNLIKTEKYTTVGNIKGSIFPDTLTEMNIYLTEIGKDYVESKLFGLNLSKYSQSDELDLFKIGTWSGNLEHICKESFETIRNYCRDAQLDAKQTYYLLTGKDYKEDKEKKVFVSYSHDNKEHKNWVSSLVKDLQKKFIVEYDENLTYGMSPENYMQQNIVSSDYVIIVFTPNYLKKVLAKENSGAKYEFSIIQEDLYRKISYGKYIPLLKDGDKDKSIPKIMQALYINFKEQNDYTTQLTNLIEKISSPD